MNSDKLSNRLAKVADSIQKGSRIADIGSDHAYLPCYLAKKGIVTFAVAGEVAEGPYLSAQNQVRLDGLSDIVQVRKGDGLEVIAAGEVDAITIAGMGGPLIASILEKGKDRLKGVKRLVLQPNIGAYSVRKWLQENDWRLSEEFILKEDGKIYEILVAEACLSGNNGMALGEAELLFGPILMKEKDEAFIEKWSAEKRNWERIIGQLEAAAPSEENKQRQHATRNKITLAEEVLA